MVVNTHERSYHAPASKVAELVATLASSTDRLWPDECWPRMEFDRGLVPGAHGGHGPVRYHVVDVDPARRVSFQFTGPSGFEGRHSFTVIPASSSVTVLRHDIQIHPRGWARVTWPLVFRPLHNALLEEALDKAGRDLGSSAPVPHRRSLWVRALRWVAAARRRVPTPVTRGK